MSVLVTHKMPMLQGPQPNKMPKFFANRSAISQLKKIHDIYFELSVEYITEKNHYSFEPLTLIHICHGIQCLYKSGLTVVIFMFFFLHKVIQPKTNV
jgi:hypothetical protein